ncbi:cytochrome b5 [Ramicandelaber brevisporus]|nr:cytochrome b5 [Ramicandelaber brevisporus]
MSEANLRNRSAATSAPEPASPAAGDAGAASTIKKRPRTERSSLGWAVGQAAIVLVILNFLASAVITDSFFWGISNYYTNWRNYLPIKPITLTPSQLAAFDGANPTKPIYIAVDGDIFDVSEGFMHYAEGGPYSMFAGKDVARAFATGCLRDPEHLTHDTRGLNEDQLKSLEGWKEFYSNHGTYWKVGKVIHPEIKADQPIPKDCKKPESKPKKSSSSPAAETKNE